MSYFAMLETDGGERLHVLRTDGFVAGKPIESFLNVLLNHCGKREDVDTEVSEVFAELQKNLSEPLCHLTRFLRQGFYAGDWDYTEAEYEWFLARSPALPLSQEEFQQALKHVKQTWVAAPALLTTIITLVDGLKKANLVSNWWYDSEATIEDFEALAQTLDLLIRRGAEKVRIKFI